MTKKLEGKIAVITGGTEGIGLATAKLFVKEGAYVFITGRRQRELDEAVKAIGANVSGVQGDVAQLADLDRLYETVSSVNRRIDIVFANAGFGEFVPFGAVTEEHFDKLFNINVRGTLFTVQKALPLLNNGGSIILNGSVALNVGRARFGSGPASGRHRHRGCARGTRRARRRRERRVSLCNRDCLQVSRQRRADQRATP
jgi:NAD(P)-dependent dehydrogenase (short-subunit alcohol dehydrogenase family)